MGAYSGLDMPTLNDIATTEGKNKGPIRTAAQLWSLVTAALSQSHGALNGATNTLGENWQDPTFEAAFRAPVDGGLASIRNSEQIVGQARPQVALGELADQITTTETEVVKRFEEWERLRIRLQQLMASADRGAGAIVQAEIIAILKRMEVLRQEAADFVTLEAEAYSKAASSMQAAGQGHSWNGPVAGSPPSPSPDSDALTPARPFDTVASFASEVGQPGTTQTEQLREAQLGDLPVGESNGEWASSDNPASGDNPGSGDTGLAGGVVSPAPTKVPPIASAPPVTAAPAGTPPAGAPLAGAVPLGRTGAGMIPVAAATGRQFTGGSIPMAARVTGGITSASTGQAPALPAEPTATARTGSRGPSVGAVPPMLSPLAMGNLKGLIGRLKPVVTQHSPGTADAGRAGVPNALRGRAARTDAEFALSTGQRTRRSRKEQDDAPETVELLDEEIWHVEQAGKARTAG